MNPTTNAPPNATPSGDLQIRSVPFAAPLGWLARGWHDLRRCPLPGLLHGAAAAAFGALLLMAAHDRFWLLAGAFSGFLLVAPLVATGLYAVSRELEAGRPASVATALAAWRPRDHRLVLFGALLAVAGTGWVLTSAAAITRFAPMPVRTPADFVDIVVLATHGHLFEGWLALGAFLAAPIFVSTVVAIPLLMDRPHGVATAVAASVVAALASVPAMALWATLFLVLSLLGMATAMVGLVVVVPWLSHASWHAYRDLVQAPPPAP